MKRVLMTLTITVALIATTGSVARADDYFERGFEYELGAIAARTVVGVGLVAVNHAIHGPHYGPYYRPAPVTHHVYYGPPVRHIYHRHKVVHHRHHKPNHRHGWHPGRHDRHDRRDHRRHR